jgi:PIN domain nuclease of toxin-antitoxin system
MLLLDTHAFIWLASDPAKLSRPAKRMLETSADSLAISLVTAWEVALLVKRGRLSLPLPPAQYLEQAIRHHGIIELPMSREVVLHAVSLPDLHGDPFDRILIAEAHLRDAALISKDRNIAAYPGTRVVW